MKDVWDEIMSAIDPKLLKGIVQFGIGALLIILGLLYVFS